MVLIKNVQIIDGSGQKPFRGDILTDGEKISAIAPVIKRSAEEIFDGLGLTAAPGFIDVNSNSDHYLTLFSNPLQKDFLLQGVTTIIGGQCGASLAPLIYGSLISLRKWAKSDSINVNWNTIAGLAQTLRKLKLGVNFATLAGHSTIRRDIVGEDLRDLTQSETEVFLKLLDQALNEGALGLSSGLAYIHSRAVSTSEIKKFVRLAARHNKIYAAHLRDEHSGLLRSVEETLFVAQETGARTIITHFRPFKGEEQNYQAALELIEKNLVKSNVYFDASPFGKSVLAIYSLLPEWAQNGGTEVMMGHLLKPAVRKQIQEELSKLELSDYAVGAAIGHEVLIGKTIGQLAKEREQSPAEILIELMIGTKLRGKLTKEDLSLETAENALFHPRALIGSNSASFGEKITDLVKMERASETFTRFLEIAANRNLPLEEAIKKITFLPAQAAGIKNRGLLKERFFADIVFLKDGKIKDVLINGKFAVKDRVVTGELAGNAIQAV